MGLALLWLPASEAALIAYTMPIWASMLAWPVLGERPTLLRVISLVMAFAGLAAIMGGNGLAASAEKLPGIVMALAGAVGFAVGTVLAKKLPLHLPPLIGRRLADRDRLSSGRHRRLVDRDAELTSRTNLGWILLVYSTVIQFCVAYVAWFAALARLPASVAAIGTMAVPVIGVVGVGDRAGRAARPRPDRRAGVHAGGRGAGDAVMSSLQNRRAARGYRRSASCSSRSRRWAGASTSRS